MKVLIVFNHPAPYKVNLFNEINKRINIDVVFERYTASNRDEKFYALNRYEFQHYFLKEGSFGEENSNTSELISFIANRQYDLIIMNGYSTLTELRTILYLNKNKIPWYLFINGGLIKKELLIKKIIKTKFISSASGYISPCPEADKYLQYYGAKKTIYHYPNSTMFESQLLSTPFNQEQKDELRKTLKLPLGKKIFISPCQFISRKNNFELINAFKNRQEYLLLIGSGEEKDEYLRFINENNLKNIIILPYKNSLELIPYYRACNCFITLSKEDIYGHTTNEAMSQGIPVISSNKVVSSLHLIKNGINGFIVDNDNEYQIQRAIDDINEKMYIHALETAKNNTIEKSAEVLSKIIMELVSK